MLRRFFTFYKLVARSNKNCVIERKNSDFKMYLESSTIFKEVSTILHHPFNCTRDCIISYEFISFTLLKFRRIANICKNFLLSELLENCCKIFLE